jgi:hypothetical protein
MKLNSKALLAAAGVAAFAFSPANAYEGGVQWQSKPGVLIGASAGVPPPGIYMFNQVFTYQTNYAGPVASSVIIPPGTKSGVQAAVDVQGFVFVPGWTFLGATYDAVLVQPFGMVSVGQPLSATHLDAVDMFSGVHNTYIVPVELSWKLGTSGFVVKTGLGIYVPDGTVQGSVGGGLSQNGFFNFGNKYWTFQPELIFSYLAGGYNLSAALYAEFNTANQPDNYTQGDIFHADFKCPVGVCQIVHPLGTLLNTQKYQLFAIGGLVEYNFGPASLSVWATQEVYAHASGALLPAGAFAPFGLPTSANQDISATTKGMTVFATLSYRLWAPEEPPKAPMFHK